MPSQLGINEFADLTFDEFQRTHLGLLPGVNGTFRRVDQSYFAVSLLQYRHWMHLTQSLQCCEASRCCELQGWRQFTF